MSPPLCTYTCQYKREFMSCPCPGAVMGEDGRARARAERTFALCKTRAMRPSRGDGSSSFAMLRNHGLLM